MIKLKIAAIFLLTFISFAEAVGPVNGVIDDFNRADENPLVTTGIWSNEIDLDGDVPCRIISNALVQQAAGNGSCYTDATYGPNAEAYSSIPDDVGNNGNYTALYVRIANGGGNIPDGYYLQWTNLTGTDTFEIYRVDDGGFVSIGGPYSQEASIGDKYLLRAEGSQICADYFNGTTWSNLGCAPDSTYSAAGNIGAATNTQNIQIDDFGGGTLPSTNALSLGFQLLKR